MTALFIKLLNGKMYLILLIMKKLITVTIVVSIQHQSGLVAGSRIESQAASLLISIGLIRIISQVIIDDCFIYFCFI